ncbi:MAG: hypothetical protein ACRD1B_10700 [Thermoanaerobaculia bacterium]
MRKKLLTNTCAWGLVGILASLSLADPAHAVATVTVVNNDAAGEGFNDPSPPDPDSAAGGNTGVTLGAQRLQAFQAAAIIWGGLINSTVEIRVGAQFDPLTCGPTGAVLGQAGPNVVFANFAGAPFANTWYVEALANALTGTDGDPASDDIFAQFNSSIGTTCAFPNVWYYGLNGAPPGTKIDFVTVVLHEIAHGLGFLSLVDLASGAKFAGFDDAYMRFLEDHTTGLRFSAMTNAQRLTASRNTGNLHWTGTQAIACGNAVLTAGRDPVTGHIEMFAPNPAQGGSSVSHFSTTLTPNQLMEPFYTGPLLVPDIDPCLLADLVAPPPPTCNGKPATIVGTDNSETIIGTLGPDVIVALGGDDVVFGGAGNDAICGGLGRDRLFGQAGRDNFKGGSGRDRINGGGGNDKMNGGGGTDRCKGGSGTDTATSCENVSGVP